MRKFELKLASLLLAPILLAGLCHAQSDENSLGVVRLKYATVVVRDYDEALRWYTDVLGFVKTEDGNFGDGKRWLVVAPRNHKEVGIILEIAKPIAPDDPIKNYDARVGAETRWVFEVEDCRKLYDRALKRGVKFVVKPADQPWGCQAMFEDLYGNIFVVNSAAKSGAAAATTLP
jgi:uncharacterized glyoxalase superfamily protein PhnB